ncbi:hypothetical protein BDZ89DRAFT_1167718 [Hymenopellis radicata]|nr:hypothetical protein BDZ89DRAFT_1167718 [Hymenopellis radicata]
MTAHGCRVSPQGPWQHHRNNIANGGVPTGTQRLAPDGAKNSMLRHLQAGSTACSGIPEPLDCIVSSFLHREIARRNPDDVSVSINKTTLRIQRRIPNAVNAYEGIGKRTAEAAFSPAPVKDKLPKISTKALAACRWTPRRAFLPRMTGLLQQGYQPTRRQPSHPSLAPPTLVSACFHSRESLLAVDSSTRSLSMRNLRMRARLELGSTAVHS